MRRLAVLLALMPLPALAHPGHGAAHETGSAFLAGLLHPLAGADHLLAMVAVGLWAATTGGRSLWALPAAFPSAMLLGAAIAAQGALLPDVEPAILASVIVLGAAIATALVVPLPLSVAAVASFGLVHGIAHGAEGPAVGALPYFAGFTMTTLALHLAGISLSRRLADIGRSAATRRLGAVTAAAGLFLLVI